MGDDQVVAREGADKVDAGTVIGVGVVMALVGVIAGACYMAPRVMSGWR